MRLTKIYTKVGDKGTTHLGSGAKISKAHLRIEAYGTIDELNAVVGYLRDTLAEINSQQLETISTQLLTIQHELFDIGGELSLPSADSKLLKDHGIKEDNTSRLEREIDEDNKCLEPLRNFILPGGHNANSVCHLARTICRRAERVAVKLNEQEQVRAEVLKYLNRLSDWFFVKGRMISKLLNVSEILWDQKK